MRNYQEMREQDSLVMEHLKGQDPLTIKEIERLTGISEFYLRKSLMRLRDRGEVRKWFARDADKPEWVYERTHGGYDPGPGEAA